MSNSSLLVGPLVKPFAYMVFGFVMLLNSIVPATAGGKINTGYFGNIAIQGYDPVAYFTKGKAIKGSEDHTVKWLGAYWQFENDEHKQLFAANPQSYAPQYGGHCASGMAVHGGRTKDIDPEAWAIIDNKLYLNYSQETHKLITEGIVSLEKANTNWKKNSTTN
jgi:hypothetical protein